MIVAWIVGPTPICARKYIKLQNALFVADLILNLLSIAKLVDKDLDVIFNKVWAVTIDKSKEQKP